MAGCAGEHHRETMVWNGLIDRFGVDGFGTELQLADGTLVGYADRRVESMAFLRATDSSQASGLAGEPFRGQSVKADTNASESASSAAARSPVRAARKATSFP